MELIKRYLTEAKKPRNFTIIAIYLLLFISVSAESLLFSFIVTLLLLLALIIYKNSILGFYLGVFSLSFDQIFIPTSFSLKIHMIIFLVTSISLVISIIQEKKIPRFPSMSLLMPLALLYFFSFISIFFSADKILTARFIGALAYAFAIFIITYLFVINKSRALRTAAVLLGSMFVSSLVAIYQFIAFYWNIDFYRRINILNPGNFARPKGLFDHTNFLANFFLTSIPIGLVLIFWGRHKNFIKIILIAVAISAFVITLSRAAYIGFIVVLIMILFFAYRDRKTTSVTKTILSIGLMSFLSVVVLMYVIGPLRLDFVPKEYLGGKSQKELLTGRVTSTTDPLAITNIERIQIWTAGMEMLKDNFVFGVGLENFKVRYKEYKLPDAKRDQVAAHNSYFQLLIETGIFGFLSFAVFWVLLFTNAVKGIVKSRDIVLRSLLIGGLAALVGVSLQNLTNSVFYSTHLWFLYGFVAALTRLNLSKR